MPGMLDIQMNETLRMAGFILFFSLILGGVPFILFLIGAFVWMRDKDGEQLRQMTFIAPIIFMAVLFGCSLVFGIVGAFIAGDPSYAAGGGGTGLILSIFAFFIGYAYVGAVNLLFLFYRWLVRAF